MGIILSGVSKQTKRLTFDVFNPTSFYQQQVIYSFQSDCYSLFFLFFVISKIILFNQQFCIDWKHDQNNEKITTWNAHTFIQS